MAYHLHFRGGRSCEGALRSVRGGCNALTDVSNARFPSKWILATVTKHMATREDLSIARPFGSELDSAGRRC
jgi:hypothetical protein